MVIESKVRSLPKCLEGLDLLGDADKKGFFYIQYRLRHIDEIIHRAKEWLASNDREGELLSLVDGLGLNLAIVLSISESSQASSWWTIHSSSAAEFDAREMSGVLGEEAMTLLDVNPPKTNEGISGIAVWLDGQIRAIEAMIERLHRAEGCLEGIALLIAVDVLLMTMQLGMSRQRFNREAR